MTPVGLVPGTFTGTGDGIDGVMEAIADHGRHVRSEAGRGQARRRIESTIRRAVTARLAENVHATPIPADVVDSVVERLTDPWSVAHSMS